MFIIISAFVRAPTDECHPPAYHHHNRASAERKKKSAQRELNSRLLSPLLNTIGAFVRAPTDECYPPADRQRVG
jgi:hypothetical protein